MLLRFFRADLHNSMDEQGLLPGFQARPDPMLANTLDMAQASAPRFSAHRGLDLHRRSCLRKLLSQMDKLIKAIRVAS